MTAHQKQLQTLRDLLPTSQALLKMASALIIDSDDEDTVAIAAYAVRHLKTEIEMLTDKIDMYVDAGHEYRTDDEQIHDAIRFAINKIYETGGNKDSHPQLFEAADLLYQAIDDKDGDA